MVEDFFEVEIVTCNFQKGKNIECQIVRKFGEDSFKTENIKNLKTFTLNSEPVPPEPIKCRLNKEFNHLRCDNEPNMMMMNQI